MNPIILSILICRGIGLFFVIAGVAALLPDLFFGRLFEPVYFGGIRSPGLSSNFSLLWQSGMGHEMLSKLLNLIFGVLLLVFSRRVARWFAAGLPPVA